MFGYAFGVLPFGGVPVGLDAHVPNPLRLLLSDPSAQLNYLMIATPDSVDPADHSTDPLTVYLSSKGFRTAPGESPANIDFRARLLNAYNFEASLPFDGAVRGGSASFGTAILENSDGKLDGLADLAWAGKPIEVKVGGVYHPGRAGEKTFLYADYERLFAGTCAGVTWDEARISLALRNPAERFAVPLQDRLFAGTGGIEGDAAVKGLPWPIGYGPCKAVPAVLFDTVNRVYRLSDGKIQSVGAVKDKGVALDFAADYASYDALVAAAIAPGEYATSLAEGLIRLGAPAEGLITVDFDGDAPVSAPDGGGYVSTAPAILRRIAGTRGNAPLDDAAEIEVTAFTGAAQLTAQLWTGTQPMTIAEALDRLSASIGAPWDFTRAGIFTLTRLEAPTPADVTLDMTRQEAGRLQRVETPEPVWRVRLGYARYHAVQSGNDLAPAPFVSESERDDLGKEYRYVASDEAAGAAVRTAYPQARELVIDTQLTDAAQAQAECDRLFALHSVKRDAYRAIDPLNLFAYRLGLPLRLKHARYGLAGGRDFRVVRLAESAATRSADLILWG